MEVEFLFAGYWLAVAGGGAEGPLLNSCDDGFVDAVAESAGHLDVCDFSGGVDDDVEDDVALGAAGKHGEVRLWRGEIAGQSDVDVAFAERVRAGGGVRIGRGGGVGIGRGGVGLQLLSRWGGKRRVRCDLLRYGLRIGCRGLNGSAAGEIGDHEIGAALVARKADGSDEGRALMDKNDE